MKPEDENRIDGKPEQSAEHSNMSESQDSFAAAMKEAADNISAGFSRMKEAFSDSRTGADLQRFGQYFSEHKLLEKLRNVARVAGAGVIYPVLLLWQLLKSPDVTLRDKAVIVGALGYFILPTDLIPDAIPIQGFADDAAALMAALRVVSSSITPEAKEAARQTLRQWLGEFDETVIDRIDSLLGPRKK